MGKETAEKKEDVAYTPVQLDLPIGKITQHFLHFCFFRVLEGGLLTQSLIAEGIGGLMGRCDSLGQLLKLSAWCSYVKNHTHFFYFCVHFLHLFDPAPIVIRTSNCIHLVPEVCAKPQA